MRDERAWALHEEPHRHYKVAVDGGKPSWNGADKQRIVSVTRVLDGGQDSLTTWAATTAVGACEDAALLYLGARAKLVALDAAQRRAFVPAAEGEECPQLTFAELAYRTGRMPDQIRDAKGRSGDLAHTYFADCLLGNPVAGDTPYGLRVALDDFIADEQPWTRTDESGPQVERAVGDYSRAVAGTYDAVLQVDSIPGWGRWDLKQSRSLHGKHFAQLAAYERCAVLGGEKPCDYLALLHITPEGAYRVVSIPTDGPDAEMALEFFDAALYRYRHEPRLDRLVKEN